MKVRRVTVSDVPRLVALNRDVQEMHAEAFPERFRRDAPKDVVARAFSAMIDSPSSYWLVAEDEHPIGFISAEFYDRDESWCMVPHRACYLAGIVVAPGCRRRGIARALLAELKREAKSRGVDRIELDVWTFNKEAKQTFASLGFHSVMERMALSTE